jgi:hypothetical protein
MLDSLVETTGLEFVANARHSDYQPGLPGARPGGRTVQNGLYDARRLGALRERLRRPAANEAPVTKLERDTWGEDTPERWDWELIRRREADGIVGQGAALIGELLEGCVTAGVDVRANAAVTGLTLADGRVRAVHDDDRLEIHAAAGVVLACGGFEWSEELCARLLGVPMRAPASPPDNVGDGLRMACGAGVALGNLAEAWWAPLLHCADAYDGAPLYRTTSGLRSMPGGILVNRRGRRFANETMNYNDLGKAMKAFDPAAYEYPNLPCWLVFDARFRGSYSVGSVRPADPDPAWMTSASSLRELAAAVGIDAAGLIAEVEAFNAGAARGEDPAWGRGTSAYDLYRGDRTQPHPTLAPLLAAPFYAVPIELGCIGTKGGPVTDPSGRVLDAGDRPLPGLFACGNVAASAFGPGYPGAGATLGAGMTAGYLCGLALAGDGAD